MKNRWLLFTVLFLLVSCGEEPTRVAKRNKGEALEQDPGNEKMLSALEKNTEVQIRLEKQHTEILQSIEKLKEAEAVLKELQSGQGNILAGQEGLSQDHEKILANMIANNKALQDRLTVILQQLSEAEKAQYYERLDELLNEVPLTGEHYFINVSLKISMINSGLTRVKKVMSSEDSAIARRTLYFDGVVNGEVGNFYAEHIHQGVEPPVLTKQDKVVEGDPATFGFETAIFIEAYKTLLLNKTEFESMAHYKAAEQSLLAPKVDQLKSLELISFNPLDSIEIVIVTKDDVNSRVLFTMQGNRFVVSKVEFIIPEIVEAREETTVAATGEGVEEIESNLSVFDFDWVSYKSQVNAAGDTFCSVQRIAIIEKDKAELVCLKKEEEGVFQQKYILAAGKLEANGESEKLEGVDLKGHSLLYFQVVAYGLINLQSETLGPHKKTAAIIEFEFRENADDPITMKMGPNAENLVTVELDSPSAGS